MGILHHIICMKKYTIRRQKKQVLFDIVVKVYLQSQKLAAKFAFVLALCKKGRWAKAHLPFLGDFEPVLTEDRPG